MLERSTDGPADDAENRVLLIVFFFFKQKTAYDIGWCDWSSDVCSSDLEVVIDYLTKPVANNDLVQAIEARLTRSARQAKREFKPDFSTTEPLVKLGLTPRAAEALLWLSQGKTNPDIATILGITESTVKKHVQEIFEKLGVETRGAPTVRALEVLNTGE